MEELKRHKLRTDYGNKTGDKIRTEHYVSFNHDYVKYLEDELLKLLNIGVVSNNKVAVCNSNSATWNADLGLMICDECGYSHPLQTDC